MLLVFLAVSTVGIAKNGAPAKPEVACRKKVDCCPTPACAQTPPGVECVDGRCVRD